MTTTEIINIIQCYRMKNKVMLLNVNVYKAITAYFTKEVEI